MENRKKLIEVALPLQAINTESLRRKQKAPKGWPTSFHKWWAQRPLAAARAVIFAQVVDDPSSWPDLFPTAKAQEKERQRLFRIIEDLVLWDNTTNESVLLAARDAIWESWRRSCAENASHPRAAELFDRYHLPTFFDPFAGSGSLPLSAQWLGLEVLSSDLNPVAVLINKAMIEIPSMFAGKPPMNPAARKDKQLFARTWRGAEGLAEDVRYYGRWMHDEAERRIGHLYPKVEVTASMIRDRPDLKQYAGQKLTVIAWLWARTVKSPNPAFASAHVPLVSSFMLSTKAGKEAFVEPVVEGSTWRFSVKVGKPQDLDSAKNGTKLGRGSSFRCLLSTSPLTAEYIRSEAQAGRMGARIMAIVAEGARGRVYLTPTAEHEEIAAAARPEWKPDLKVPTPCHDVDRLPMYGMPSWGDAFTPRQLVALTSFSDLVGEIMERVRCDAESAGLGSNGLPLREGGTSAVAYSQAIGVYLACVVDRMAYYGSSLTSWLPKDNALRDCMPRQALAMVWDFAEGNPLGKSSGDVLTCLGSVSNYLDVATPSAKGSALQMDAQTGLGRDGSVIISTDPPYYDNVGYADLSDFFYVWLRPSMRSVFPSLFSTLAVPKTEELVATPYRHGSTEAAERFFLEGMTQAMHRLVQQAHPAFPVTIYYAFKQAETEGNLGTSSTGWETFLEAVVNAGFSITGTWPMRTEGAGRMVASGTNALASSIVLVCRRRVDSAPTATRRDFLAALKQEMGPALAHLQRGGIAPVDLAQAAIGPGMAVYTRYSSVLDASGTPLSVRDALALINQILDEVLAEQEGDFDGDTRWAIAWFDQSGFAEGEFGVAETLSKAKNTSVAGMVAAGILSSKAGKVRLFRPAELPAEWMPETDPRLSAWEAVHHLVRVLEAGGEAAAADLIRRLGSRAELARELAYRLYSLCERKKRAAEALSYNALVQSWPEIARLAREQAVAKPTQGELF